ncbi:MAG TPA: ABC transporter ATP-binding protein [Candidatus Sulfopaludibacter sp.]|nr:ABC transporter ATP-binding protein [Candidatus Sulfopaludibacter sp.]
MRSESAVSVADLCKRYGAVEVLRGVSFEVGAGQIFGLLGPNGAGKTTTLECILGLRRQDRGSIRINGLLGAQLQAATLQDKITPRQALDLFGAFYPRPFASGELLQRFDLEAKADVAFATLSSGQQQRLFLALALVNRPTLLVLDEPTAGLDPKARRDLRDLIREMRSENRTVLLSTHDLEEAAQLCDQIAILDGGRVVAMAPPDELISRSPSPARVTVRTAPPLESRVVDSLPALSSAAYRDGGWTLETSAPSRLLPELVRCTGEAGVELLDIQVRRPSLEDVFLELTGHPWSAAEPPGAVS